MRGQDVDAVAEAREFHNKLTAMESMVERLEGLVKDSTQRIEQADQRHEMMLELIPDQTPRHQLLPQGLLKEGASRDLEP